MEDRQRVTEEFAIRDPVQPLDGSDGRGRHRRSRLETGHDTDMTQQTTVVGGVMRYVCGGQRGGLRVHGRAEQKHNQSEPRTRVPAWRHWFQA
jgi:hypothetical protein